MHIHCVQYKIGVYNHKSIRRLVNFESWRSSDLRFSKGLMSYYDDGIPTVGLSTYILRVGLY